MPSLRYGNQVHVSTERYRNRRICSNREQTWRIRKGAHEGLMFDRPLLIPTLGPSVDLLPLSLASSSYSNSGTSVLPGCSTANPATVAVMAAAAAAVAAAHQSTSGCIGDPTSSPLLHPLQHPPCPAPQEALLLHPASTAIDPRWIATASGHHPTSETIFLHPVATSTNSIERWVTLGREPGSCPTSNNNSNTTTR